VALREINLGRGGRNLGNNPQAKCFEPFDGVEIVQQIPDLLSYHAASCSK
jgi:hypothetical protein